MAHEQRRAERIQSEFQKLLAELKSQDEQVKTLFEEGDVELPTLLSGDHPPDPSRILPDAPLRGFVVRC